MHYNTKHFLIAHIQSIMDFYHPRVIDYDLGGYINQLKDDGTIYDRSTKHLVGTCRFIYNYSIASRVTGNTDYRHAAAHGLAFLQAHHRQPDGGYAWVLQGREVEDASRHCYGHAFVLLAAAAAAQENVAGAGELVDSTFELLEARFFEPAAGLYVDVIHPGSWHEIDPYRGQNANMHLCEALLAAFEATDNDRYLNRAYQLARKICIELAEQTDGLIWEHYRTDWSVDWRYNIDDPKNLFRPHGFLPGHFVEWSKLLLTLYRHRPEPWMLERARALFAKAVDQAWDDANGGLHYAFGRDGTILDSDRYYWVLAEAFAAAALLGQQTGAEQYWRWYDTFWSYSDKFFVDHRYGGWYRVLDQHGNKYSDLKSPPAKTDYHPLSACYTALGAIEAKR